MEWDEQRLGRRLKLRDLNILIAVARTGSMGKAAAQLSISQPAVSRAVADIEAALGVRVLDRLPQGVTPTIYGQALLDRGVVAFDELKQAMQHIEFLADPTAGEIRVGSSIVLAEVFVTAIIERLSRRYPRLTFHLMAGESSTMYSALEQRKIDLAVIGIFQPISEDRFNAEILYHHDYAVAAGSSSPWARRRKVSLSDLVNEPWALPPPDTLTGAVSVEAFRAHGLPVPRATVFVVTTPVRNALVGTGRFLTIVPDSVFAFRADDLRIRRLPIALPTTRRPVGIITLKNRTISPVAQLFVQYARELAKELDRT
jgi:DNA-binding transcriptional LysR family regulator